MTPIVNFVLTGGMELPRLPQPGDWAIAPSGYDQAGFPVRTCSSRIERRLAKKMGGSDV